VIATAHVDAFLEAIQSDADQAARSKYIQFFQMPEDLQNPSSWQTALKIYAVCIKGRFNRKSLSGTWSDSLKEVP